MDHLKELEGKRAHDKFNHHKAFGEHGAGRVWVPGPVIVGGGPSGLAVAACLKQKGVPHVVLERSSCIGSLWQLRTYDRLRLHLPKEYCELPGLGYPPETPNYPTRRQFIAYLESYVKHFEIKPVFGMKVVGAEFDEKRELWTVKAAGDEGVIEYVCRWVVVATGENAEPAFPKIEGLEDFKGRVVHTTEYKCGSEFRGKSALVVGSGNSGMEISLDLFNHSANTGIVIRDSMHVLPKEILGWSTFGFGYRLLKWLPVSVVDRMILVMSRLILGDTEKLGIRRPAKGPLTLKNSGEGKTPVLDVGTLAEIRAGNIKVYPGIRRIMEDSVEFVDGRIERFDGIILATGFKSDVPSWLKGSNMFSEKDGYPVKPFPNGWKGEKGLYAAGFTRRAILGVSHDAQRVAEDISNIWMKIDKESDGNPYATFALKS